MLPIYCIRWFILYTERTHAEQANRISGAAWMKSSICILLYYWRLHKTRWKCGAPMKLWMKMRNSSRPPGHIECRHCCCCWALVRDRWLVCNVNKIRCWFAHLFLLLLLFFQHMLHTIVQCGPRILSSSICSMWDELKEEAAEKENRKKATTCNAIKLYNSWNVLCIGDGVLFSAICDLNAW